MTKARTNSGRSWKLWVPVPGGVCAGLIEIIDARGVRFFGEERKDLSFGDRIAIRQIGHCGQGVNPSFEAFNRSRISPIKLSISLIFLSLCAFAGRARDIMRSRPG